MKNNLPEVGGAPDETLIMGTGPPPPDVPAGVPPSFPWEVGESGARGIAGDESGVVYLGIPNRLSFLLTFR